METIREKVQHLIDTAINPAVEMHGGFVELIDVKENVVYLAMGGGCQGCGMADVTLKQGITALIEEEVPEVAEVLDVTDHAARRLGVEITVGSDRVHVLAERQPRGTLAFNFREPAEAARAVVEFARTHPVDAVVGVDHDTTVLAAVISAALREAHSRLEFSIMPREARGAT